MRIGVIGHSGKVGELLTKVYDCIPLDCDIRDEFGIGKAIKKEKPDVVVSLAAKSSPDWCETHKEDALQVNYVGVANLARVTSGMGLPVVVISTDHVFSGRTYYDFEVQSWVTRGAYSESNNKTLPVNYYGVTKLGAESVASMYEYMNIVRTSYLFSKNRPSVHQGSYPAFMERSFMYIEHFAESLHEYLQRVNEMPKLLHISGSETVSWKKFMKALAPNAKLKFHYRDNNKYTPRPHKAGLKVDLSEKLGLPQYSYLDGIECL